MPLYRQLEEILKQRIKNGELKPGDQIPTEYELCEDFGISRISVRQALAELANDGFLCRHQGRGTFVNDLASSESKLLRVLIAEEQWIPPLREAVRLYNEEGHESDIRLEVQAVGRPQLRSEILSAVGRGEAPDVALIDWAWTVEFADLHFLKRLDGRQSSKRISFQPSSTRQLRHCMESNRRQMSRRSGTARTGLRTKGSTLQELGMSLLRFPVISKRQQNTHCPLLGGRGRERRRLTSCSRSFGREAETCSPTGM